ncbi:hypothetical protein CHS0354_038275 [Potamilus streckersoni]|uniref:Uncharacterized protein n=1 Tax=Potamilus streckersoni TaxID=2493646 RepID=A0AAE0TDE7_9BIVA|nr:hypothetical protein CHS0354_038275 [Potamilus streckersoni]
MKEKVMGKCMALMLFPKVNHEGSKIMGKRLARILFLKVNHEGSKVMGKRLARILFLQGIFSNAAKLLNENLSSSNQ